MSGSTERLIGRCHLGVELVIITLPTQLKPNTIEKLDLSIQKYFSKLLKFVGI